MHRHFVLVLCLYSVGAAVIGVSSTQDDEDFKSIEDTDLPNSHKETFLREKRCSGLLGCGIGAIVGVPDLIGEHGIVGNVRISLGGGGGGGGKGPARANSRANGGSVISNANGGGGRYGGNRASNANRGSGGGEWDRQYLNYEY